MYYNPIKDFCQRTIKDFCQLCCKYLITRAVAFSTFYTCRITFLYPGQRLEVVAKVVAVIFEFSTSANWYWPISGLETTDVDQKCHKDSGMGTTSLRPSYGGSHPRCCFS